MSLVKYERSIIFSSDANLPGVSNKSADGSTFTVSLSNPLSFPVSAVAPTIEVNRASIPYSGREREVADGRSPVTNGDGAAPVQERAGGSRYRSDPERRHQESGSGRGA